MSQNCWGQATTGFLVEVAKLELEEMRAWKEKYPEAFARDYDPASGNQYKSWVEGNI